MDLETLKTHLKTAIENKAIINLKISEKSNYVSKAQIQVWKIQRRHVVKLINEIKCKIDLHPETKFK